MWGTVDRQVTIMRMIDPQSFTFWPSAGIVESAGNAGFRLGDKGTHTSRTIMLGELTAVLAAEGPDAVRSDYARAIIEANCLAKPTASTRRLTNQRLGELYALDPSVPIFRILRRLWDVDQIGRPLLALLAALARDPLLMATAPSVVPLREGAEFVRGPMKMALEAAVGARLNGAILDKVVRNAASSWRQSGHLEGRTFKKRRLVRATPATVAFALYLGYMAGFRGREVLASGWVSVLDASPAAAQELAIAAKRQGLIDLRTAGEVLELGLERLDPLKRRA